MSSHTVKCILLLLLLLPAGGAAQLIISGVDAQVEQNIRAYVALASEPCDAESWRVRRRFRALEAEVKKSLEPFGYYNPIIEASLGSDETCWRAVLSILPGEAVKLRNVDIDIVGAAALDPSFSDLLQPKSLQSGANLRHVFYDGFKRALQVRAAERGYLEAVFIDSRLDVWPEENAADISLQFDSGPRYRFGKIYQDQSFLEPALVSGLLALEPGTPFDGRELARAYRDLSNSNYFSRIEVVPDLGSAENEQVPIRVSLQPADRIEYTIGVGASTDTGPRFRAGHRNNRINTRGHRFIADLAISPIVQGITAEYRIPLRDPRSEWLSATGAVSNEDVDTFDNEMQRLGLRWTKALSKSWLRTLSLDLSNESFAVGSDVKTSRSFVPAIAFDHKRSDRDIFPGRGRRLGMEFRGTDPALGSDASYMQVSTWMRWVSSFGSRNRVLTRLNAGATTTGDFGGLPPSVRFFAGGDESVRGFDYNSLGPKDSDGNVVGGTNLLVVSLEYERHLRGNFYGALFVDAGNAFDDIEIDPAVGTGLGLKWKSPLGPIRFYLGFPLNQDEDGVRVHLRLGADL